MVRTAVHDPILVEPKVTDDKVRELIRRRRESAKLDYKTQYDPSSTPARQRLAKHVLAMTNTVGGYILVGVENDGTEVGLAAAAAARIASPAAATARQTRGAPSWNDSGSDDTLLIPPSILSPETRRQCFNSATS